MSAFTAINTRSAARSAPAPAPPDPRATAMRRPETTDTSKFWYISQANWDALVAETSTQDKEKLKKELNQLRKYDKAGRLMETPDGVAAVVVCDNCTKATTYEVCTIAKDGATKSCARCTRDSKASYKASLVAEPLSAEEQLAALEAQFQERIRSLDERVESLEEALHEEQSTVVGLQMALADTQERVATLEGQRERDEARLNAGLQHYRDVAWDIEHLWTFYERAGGTRPR